MWDDVVEETPAPAAQEPAPAGDAPAGEASADAKPEVAEPPPPENNTKNEPRRLLFKHWIRLANNNLSLVSILFRNTTRKLSR